MAFDLFLRPATVAIPTKDALKWFGWSHINDDEVASAVAEEEQYFRFHLELLEKLHFTAEGKASSPTYVSKLDLTMRAGLVRSAVLLSASIAEAVLLHHAQRRGFHLPPKPVHWNFRAAMCAWEDPPNSEAPRSEIEAVWGQLKELRGLRNNVHLFKKAADGQGRFRWLLEHEKRLISLSETVLNHLRELQSP